MRCKGIIIIPNKGACTEIHHRPPPTGAHVHRRNVNHSSQGRARRSVCSASTRQRARSEEVAQSRNFCQRRSLSHALRAHATKAGRARAQDSRRRLLQTHERRKGVTTNKHAFIARQYPPSFLLMLLLIGAHVHRRSLITPARVARDATKSPSELGIRRVARARPAAVTFIGAGGGAGGALRARATSAGRVRAQDSPRRRRQACVRRNEVPKMTKATFHRKALPTVVDRSARTLAQRQSLRPGLRATQRELRQHPAAGARTPSVQAGPECKPFVATGGSRS